MSLRRYINTPRLHIPYPSFSTQSINHHHQPPPTTTQRQWTLADGTRLQAKNRALTGGSRAEDGAADLPLNYMQGLGACCAACLVGWLVVFWWMVVLCCVVL
jgi:hypothetical protein